MSDISFHNFILRQDSKGIVAIIGGIFDTGPQGSFCSRQICSQLRQAGIHFYSITQESRSTIEGDVYRQLIEKSELRPYSEKMANSLELTSLNMQVVPAYIRCQTVCRYDIGRGNENRCIGIALHGLSDRRRFIDLGGTLFQPKQMQHLKFSKNPESDYLANIHWPFRSYERDRLERLGIKFFERPTLPKSRWRSVFVITDENSMIACALSGAKMPHIEPLLQKYGCTLPMVR